MLLRRGLRVRLRLCVLLWLCVLFGRRALLGFRTRLRSRTRLRRLSFATFHLLLLLRRRVVLRTRLRRDLLWLRLRRHAPRLWRIRLRMLIELSRLVRLHVLTSWLVVRLRRVWPHVVWRGRLGVSWVIRERLRRRGGIARRVRRIFRAAGVSVIAVVYVGRPIVR